MIYGISYLHPVFVSSFLLLYITCDQHFCVLNFVFFWISHEYNETEPYFNGLVQERRNSIAKAMGVTSFLH